MDHCCSPYHLRVRGEEEEEEEEEEDSHSGIYAINHRRYVVASYIPSASAGDLSDAVTMMTKSLFVSMSDRRHTVTEPFDSGTVYISSTNSTSTTVCVRGLESAYEGYILAVKNQHDYNLLACSCSIPSSSIIVTQDSSPVKFTRTVNISFPSRPI